MKLLKLILNKKITDLQINHSSNDKTKTPLLEYSRKQNTFLDIINKSNYQDALKQKFYKQIDVSVEIEQENFYQSDRRDHFRVLSNNENTINTGTQTKYSDKSVSSGHSKVPRYPMMNTTDKNRNRFITNKSLGYDRIGSKSPATRKRNINNR